MTARKLNQVLWDQWRQQVKRQRESGLSIAEFCRRERVSPHSFHAWKRKLREAGAVRHTSRSAAAGKRSGNRQAIVTPRRKPRHTIADPLPPGSRGFLELPMAAVRPSPFIEVALADGTVIRVPQQNVTALVAMLRVLRGDRGEPEGCHA